VCVPVSGVWSVWSAWGDCSSPCSRGVRRRSRTCLYRVPVDPDAAVPCHGDTSQRVACTGSCQGQLIGIMLTTINQSINMSICIAQNKQSKGKGTV